MPAVIATLNLKGGVGKTTVTAGLGEFLAGEFGRRVLLVDLDSQMNLTAMMIGADRWTELNDRGATLATLFADVVDGTENFRLSEALQRDVSSVDGVDTVDLLPSSLDLVEITEELSALRVRRDDTLAAVGTLADALRPVLDDYDVVLLDCPPSMGPLTLNGLAMADGYLVPTIPDVLSTYGIGQVQKQIMRFAEEIGRPIVELGVVVSKYRAAATLHRDTVLRLRRDPTIAHVLPGYIGEANAVAAAAHHDRYPSLRARYGGRGQFEQFRELARTVLTEAERKLVRRDV
ncbi:ParA family protein [Williamsia deligens]|uniref:ParA family protein n=1 Tax=Williamsia deligens TaxID=321325 RepID=A0ABW3G8L6_9NOCA|nr:AAA family ATPase [Williamsia deligens]MCP2192769.1 chromosome partitioning protein [Williamsia deligens]